MIYTASRDYGVKRKILHFLTIHALQGISSAIAHIERFSVYRKSQQGFISTRVSTRNKALLRLWDNLSCDNNSVQKKGL